MRKQIQDTNDCQIKFNFWHALFQANQRTDVFVADNFQRDLQAIRAAQEEIAQPLPPPVGTALAAPSVLPPLAAPTSPPALAGPQSMALPLPPPPPMAPLMQPPTTPAPNEAGGATPLFGAAPPNGGVPTLPPPAHKAGGDRWDSPFAKASSSAPTYFRMDTPGNTTLDDSNQNPSPWSSQTSQFTQSGKSQRRGNSGSNWGAKKGRFEEQCNVYRCRKPNCQRWCFGNFHTCCAKCEPTDGKELSLIHI